MGREVIVALTGGAWDDYLACIGDCAAHSADKVRDVVAAGASRISFNGNGADVPTDLAGFIDHTLLRADASAAEIDRMCDEAIAYGFAAVCVNPAWVKRVADHVRGTDVIACSVIGFPLGAHTPQIKAMEARQAIRDGAREIDMVINVGALKSGDYGLVLRDIAGVADAAREAGTVCKVIIEAGEHEGVYLAEFDLTRIRRWREREVWGNAFRRPHRYSLLTSLYVERPFIRTNADGEAFQRAQR